MSTASHSHSASVRRAQLALLSRTLEREAHILLREPKVVPSHLHNTLFLEEGEEGPAGTLLAAARDALGGRPWLRLTNRPPVERSALLRVLDHGDAVNAIAWSPDGTLLVSAGADGIARVWEGSKGRSVAVLEAHAGEIQALAWFRETLASGHGDGTVRLWDPVMGKQGDVLEGHTDAVWALAWSPDGALLASGGRDGTVRLWDPATEKVLSILEGHFGMVRAMAWSPDGALLASGDWHGTIRLWDPAAVEKRAVLAEGTGLVFALAWSPDGTLLASASTVVLGPRTAGTVQLWELATGKPKTILHEIPGGASALGWSSDGAFLACGVGNGEVRLWDRAAEKDLALSTGHSEVVFSLAWSPDGRTLASGGFDKTVRLSDPRTMRGATAPKPPAVPAGHAQPVGDVAWSPDGHTLASGGEDGTMRLWDTATGAPKAVLDLPGPVFAVASSPGGVLWAPAISETTVWMWEGATGAQKAILENLPGPVFALASSADAILLASGDVTGTVRVWEMATGKVRAILSAEGASKEDPEPVRALAWSPDGVLLASGDVAGTVRVWDTDMGKQRAVLEPQMASTTTLHLISAVLTTQQGTIHLLRAAYGLAWSPDGAILASGSRDRIVRLWDCYAGEGGAVLRGHTDDINAVVWSANGALLASGSRDNTVRLWDPASGTCLAMAHCLSPILALQFSAEGRILRAADDGAATGNRPLPYLFELCNIEIGPPVQRRGIEAVPAEKEAAKPEEAPLERPGREKPRPKPLPRPSREEQRAAARSLGHLLDATGLRYSGSGDSVAVPFQSERADQLVVHARKLRDDLAYLAVTLPQPGWLGQEKALHNLLQVSFDANYAKALALGSGELAFAVELPVELLTPEMVEGVVRGLSHLGDVKKGDLANWEGWQRRLRECTLAQAASFQVDVQQAEETIPSLAQAAGLSCREVERGVYLMDWEVAGLRVGLVARVREPVISFILSLGGVKPKGDRKRYLRRLLELNRATNVAKVGLDSDGDVALLYEVPQVLPELLDKARAQLQLLLLGVIALEAGK